MKLVIIVDRFANRAETPALADSLKKAALKEKIPVSIFNAHKSFTLTIDKIHRKIFGHYATSNDLKQLLRETKGSLMFFFKPNYLGKEDVIKLQKNDNKCVWYSGDNPRYPWNITKKNTKALSQFDERFTVNIPNYYQFFEERNLSYIKIDKSALDGLITAKSINDNLQNLCFVGTGTKLRHEYFYELSNNLEIEVNVFGNRWLPDKLGTSKLHLSINRKDLAKVFRKYKYNLNLFRLENADTQNTRLYELLLAKAFIITQKNDFTKRLFGNSRFLLDDISPKNVADLIRFYERNSEQYKFDYLKMYENKEIEKFKYSSTAKIIIEHLKKNYAL